MATNGFAVKDIQLGTISVNDNWANQYGNSNAKLPHYQISNSVSVTTSNVDLVAKVSQNAGELVNQGVIVTNNSISYFIIISIALKHKCWIVQPRMLNLLPRLC